MKPSDTHDLEDLIRAHGPFLHRLARALTSDAAAAEDLVGETWVAALRPSRGPLRDQRGWLATVLQRRAATAMRSAPALSMDEVEPQPSPEPAPDEVLIRIEREQLVNGALARLREPYRSVLFLRYHDGLSPSAIAKRTETSRNTVSTRISRGLEHLRRSLDQEMTRRGSTDPRTEWLGALLPVAFRQGAPVALPSLVAVTMKKLVTIAIAALVLTAAGIWAVGFFGSRADGDSTPPGGQTGPIDPVSHASVAGKGSDLGVQGLDLAVELESPTQDVSPTGLRDQVPVALVAETETTDEIEAQIILGVAGTVAIVDGPSVDPSSLDGEIAITFWGERNGIPMDVKVTDGAFRAEFEKLADGTLCLVGEGNRISPGVDPTKVYFKDPAFPSVGQLYVVDETTHSPVGNGLETNLKFGADDAQVWLKRAPTTRLHVVDKATGAALSGVEVQGLRGGSRRAKHPEGSRTKSLTAQTNSPVTLSAPATFVQKGKITALVKAEGYAWTPVTLDLHEGAERRVELERGGALSVKVEGEIPSSAALRLYQVDPRSEVSEVKLARKSGALWEALTPGQYRAQVEIGASYRGLTVLATEDVFVEVGSQAELTLTPEEVVAAKRASASGVLVVPEGWPVDDLKARVELIGASSDGSAQEAHLEKADLSAMDVLPGSYLFELPELEVGQYVFELVAPLHWRIVYELPPEGTANLRFEVPAPVRVSVQVIDAATSEPLPAGKLSWYAAPPLGAGRWSSNSAGEPEAAGLFQFDVTRGPIRLQLFDSDLGFASKDVEAEDGAEFTLEVRRPARAFVTLLDGDVQVPVPMTRSYVVERVDDGEGHRSSSGNVDGRAYFGVSEPGRYRLTLPDINGYQPHAPVEFDMVEGEDTEVVIQLTSR